VTATGLTRDDLRAALPDRVRPWLARVLDEELEAGRVVQRDGQLALRPERFDASTFAALAALDLAGVPA
jgi:hypothetical protein